MVVDFASGAERWEVMPAFNNGRGGTSVDVYEIPGASSGWIETAPVAHIQYVNGINDTAGRRGGAKKLARLVKAWKYYNNVPISSFYLEMRAAEHMATQSNFLPLWDLTLLLEKLDDHGLAAMNDPKRLAGRFHPCSSEAKKTDALSKLASGAWRARKALDAQQDEKTELAFEWLNKVFDGNFPSR